MDLSLPHRFVYVTHTWANKSKEFSLPFEQEDRPERYGWTITNSNSYRIGSDMVSMKKFRNASDVVSRNGQRGKTECFFLGADNNNLSFNAGLVRMDTKSPTRWPTALFN